MNQLTSPINIQDDPFEKIVRTSHVDPNEANSLFDEYFGSLLVPNQQIRVDHLQPVNDSSSFDIEAEFHPDQVNEAEKDICLLQNADYLSCSETALESYQSTKSSDEVRPKTPAHSSPLSTNQYRTGVTFESRTKRTESLRSKRDRKKADAQSFRTRFRKSLRDLNSAIDCHLGIQHRSQIQIIQAATKLLRNQ